jgi:non-ribosomal peptide synthetase-like protein
MKLLSRLLPIIGPLPFLLLALVTAGLGLGAAAWVFEQLHPLCDYPQAWLRYALLGILLACSYATFGLVLILIAPLFNALLGGRLTPYRGPATSLAALRWYVHCTMTLIVRLSFLEFVTPSPFNNLFYRLMGMKIGRNVVINSSAIADPSMITLEENVTIGGSASIMAHYAQGGYLVISPVLIRRGATIGLRAVVMGGCEVGEKAKLLANSFLLPNSKVPAGETWAGIPACKIELHKGSSQEA